jgi:hypothetical protein
MPECSYRASISSISHGFPLKIPVVNCVLKLVHETHEKRDQKDNQDKQDNMIQSILFILSKIRPE